MIDFLKDNFGWFLLAGLLVAAFFGAMGIYDDIEPKRSRRRFQQEINSRFEKAINMATDSTNQMQRKMGLVALRQIFSSNEENFALTGENRAILEYLASKNFKVLGDIRNSFQDINARFEKAINMAADTTNQMQREMGFVALGKMFSSNRENFDALTEENKGILEYLALNNFKMTGDIRNSFLKLLKESKVRYGEDGPNLSELLYDKTHYPDIDNGALSLWKEIVNWKRREIDLRPVVGIFTTARWQPRTHFFIFSRVNLSGIRFLVEFGDGIIDFPTEGMYVNFSQCCFIEVEMQGAVVSYVDFSHSHLSHVNRINYGADCNMKCIGTIFDSANLIDCNFRGANFKNASFGETNITGSDFCEAKNLTQKQFKAGAYWIRPGRPLFPSNFPRDFADTLPDRAPE